MIAVLHLQDPGNAHHYLLVGLMYTLVFSAMLDNQCTNLSMMSPYNCFMFELSSFIFQILTIQLKLNNTCLHSNIFNVLH